MKLVLVVDGEGQRAFRLPGGQSVPVLSGGETLEFVSPLDIYGVNDPFAGDFFGEPSFPGGDAFAINPSTGGDFEGSDIGAIQQRIRDDMDLNEVLVNDDGQLVDSAGRPVPPGSSTWQKVKDVLQGTSAAINSPLGRLLTTLGLGLAGHGLGQLVANKPGRLTLPAPTAGQNPVLLEGGRLMEAALKDPVAAAAFQEAVKRSLVGQSTAAGFLNETIAREASFANKTAGATEALRTFGLSEMPKFLADEADVANFANVAGAVDPGINAALNTRWGYPQNTPEWNARFNAALATIKGRAQPAAAPAEPASIPTAGPYGTLVPAAYGHVNEVFQRVQKGELTGEAQIREALGNVAGLGADEYNALVRYLLPGGAGGAGAGGGNVVPNPLDPLLQAKAQTLVLGSPADFALAPDPIQGAMRDRVLRAVQGGEIDPALERQIAEDLEILRNKLKLAYGTTGSEWDSTLGQNLYLKALESAKALRYGVNRDVINSMGPQEAARRTFQITNPQQMYLSESGIFVPAAERSTEFNQQARAQNEQLRQNELNMLLTQRNTALRNAAEVKATAEAQRRTLATFNPVNLSVLNPAASTFSSIVSIPSLSNVNDSASRLAIDAARNNAVQAAFEAERRSEAARVKSFTDIFGAAAGAATRPDIIYRGEDPG